MICSAKSRVLSAFSPIYSDVEDAPAPPQGDSDTLSVRPNPFNPVVEVVFRAQSGKERADIRLLDVTGKVVSSGTFRTRQGLNSIPFNLSGKPSGVYIVEVRMGGERRVARAFLIR